MGQHGEFNGTLSADVVRYLIATFAVAVPGHALRWEFGKLRSNLWGEYRSSTRTIIVNETKTRDRFMQQVETLLHEIQHANQHAADLLGTDTAGMWASRRAAKAANGYWNSPVERDARAFATANLSAAMAGIGRLYGGRVDGDLDDVIEELLDLWEDQGTLTRKDVGEALRDYDMNNAANLRAVIATLRELGAEVK